MSESIFVVGTNTGIGKTFVSGGIVSTLNKCNKNVCYFKPVQSGISTDEDNNLSDVGFVKRASSIQQDTREMNTYSFTEPLSPHLASKRENIKIDINKIVEQYKKLKKLYDYIVIEGAGGVIVPITENYYIYDLIKDMNSKVVVVADSKIGTINHTCLTIDFLKRQDMEVSSIIINKYNGSFYEDDNIKMIEKISNIKVKIIMKELDIKNENINNSNILNSVKQEYGRSLSKERVLELFKTKD